MANEFLTDRVARIVFDTASFDRSEVSNKTIATHTLATFIPSGAIIKNAYYLVNTTFTSATDAATIAFSVEGAGDLKAAIAISDASNVWDAGLHGCLPGSYAEATVAGDSAILDAARKAASYVLTTAIREVTAAVAVEVLTGGKLTLCIEYSAL